jgi:hypothetical protein
VVEQRREVAVAGCGEEGPDDLMVDGAVAVRRAVRCSEPPARPASQRSYGDGLAPEDHCDLVERNTEHFVQHEREPLGRRQSVEHDQQRKPHRVGQHRLVLGTTAAFRNEIPLLDRASSGASPRDVRVRSMFRQTRATTVVSQPPRLSMPSGERLSRSHASCTASSASVAEPSIRKATARRWPR